MCSNDSDLGHIFSIFIIQYNKKKKQKGIYFEKKEIFLYSQLLYDCLHGGPTEPTKSKAIMINKLVRL